jgi:hypothetical protein
MHSFSRLSSDRPPIDDETGRAPAERSEHVTHGARQEELPVVFEVSDQPQQNPWIKLGIDIVDDDRQALGSPILHDHQRSKTEGSRRNLGLTGAENVPNRFSIRPEIHVMSVRALSGKAGLSVPHPGLIIPFSVPFFQLHEVFDRFDCRITAVVD